MSTPDELDRIAEREDARRNETAAWHRRMRAAATEPGLLGDLRRAITAARREPSELAGAADLAVERLEEFRAGVTSLTDAEIARLADALQLRLAPVA